MVGKIKELEKKQDLDIKKQAVEPKKEENQIITPVIEEGEIKDPFKEGINDNINTDNDPKDNKKKEN